MPADYQGKQHTIAKSFSPVKAGENIKLTAKMRVQKLASFYNSSGYAKISLSSLDGNIEKDLIKLRCAGYGKTHEILMADQADGNGEVMYWASDWNNKDLDLTVNIIQNASGNYDITVSLYDFRTKNTLSYTAENYITPEEIEKLGVFRITAHRVGGSSDQKGSKLFGIKNILLTKDILESGAQDLLFNENEKLAVDFDNVTEWPFNADIVVGAYKDGKLINTEIIKYKDIDKAEGELRFTPTECGQDYFKLFLFDSIENIIPKKKAEKFNLTN